MINSGLALARAPITRSFTDHWVPYGCRVELSAYHPDGSLEYQAPPPWRLDTQNKLEIRQVLNYAGSILREDSPAERLAHQIFRDAREFAWLYWNGPITFDWDHVVSNYKLFEDLDKLLGVKLSKKFADRYAEAPMAVVEGLRPYMLELVTGLMVGSALRQDVLTFAEWETAYQPRVGIATLTWPDRIGVQARSYLPVMSLLEGVLPGNPKINIYDRLTGEKARAFIHLHDFLAYGDDMMDRFEASGPTSLNLDDRLDLLNYFADGKAHYRKPIGAFAAKGWEVSTLLHVEDSHDVCRDIIDHGAHAVYVQHPWTKPWSRKGSPVSEVDKVLLSDTLIETLSFHGLAGLATIRRSRDSKIESAVGTLTRTEVKHPAITQVLRGFNGIANELGARTLFQIQTDARDESTALEMDGFTYLTHVMNTTLGIFRESYVDPAHGRKARIQRLRRQHRGMKALRKKLS